VRCFIALGMEDGPEATLAPWLEATRAVYPELAVSSAGNLHLTLAFMANVGEEQVELVGSAMRAAADRRCIWLLLWTSPGVFPSRARPRVLWLGVDGGVTLAEMHAAVNAGLAPPGLVAEERAFRPHLTLARVRRGEISRERLKDIVAHLGTLPVPQPSRAVALVLYQSQLGRGPAVHTPLLTVPLAGPGS
jgi:RNA 2',3'-cyclic 3'-phosphodiesterase